MAFMYQGNSRGAEGNNRKLQRGIAMWGVGTDGARRILVWHSGGGGWAGGGGGSRFIPSTAQIWWLMARRVCFNRRHHPQLIFFGQSGPIKNTVRR